MTVATKPAVQRGGIAPVADGEFRFDAIEHAYYIDGLRVPSITQMLEDAGYIDDTYYTEECAERGSIVHQLTADYDLGAIPEPARVESIWKGYFLAHVDAMRTIRPSWVEIEVAHASKAHGYGGRPDRLGRMWSTVSDVDIKTGGPADWHGIQTALQVILAAPTFNLPPKMIPRFGLYLKANGKWKLDEHKSPRDFDTAYEVIKECGRAR